MLTCGEQQPLINISESIRLVRWKKAFLIYFP